MEFEIKNLLFTSDLTEASRYVFNYAANLANHYGAKITILHVMEEMSDNIKGMLGGILNDERLEELRARHSQEAMTTLVGKSKERSIIREGLEMFTQDAVAGMPHVKGLETDEVIVTSGHIVDEILRVAKEKKCDLIVLGSHQRGAIAEAMLGATVKHVLRRTKAPVFVVPLPEKLA
ncbi:MAG: universal stress protein [Pseudomonadota bacterium]